MANRAIIYAIYPNKIQEEQCRKTFGCCRFVHNQMLTIQPFLQKFLFFVIWHIICAGRNLQAILQMTCPDATTIHL